MILAVEALGLVMIVEVVVVVATGVVAEVMIDDVISGGSLLIAAKN